MAAATLARDLQGAENGDEEANQAAHVVQGRQAGAPLHRAIQNSEAGEDALG